MDTHNLELVSNLLNLIDVDKQPVHVEEEEEELQIIATNKRKLDTNTWTNTSDKKKRQKTISGYVTSKNQQKMRREKRDTIPDNNFLLLTKPKEHVLQGFNPNHVNLGHLNYFSYIHANTDKNVMLLWVRRELTRRCLRSKLVIDRLSSKSVFYDSPKIAPNDEITQSMSDELIERHESVITKIHTFWDNLVSTFKIVCTTMKEIIVSKKEGKPVSKETICMNPFYEILELNFGILWNENMHECRKIDLLILCNSISKTFSRPTDMFDLLLGFDKKYPFFHQQEGIVHFFWSILRSSLMVDKNCVFMDHMGTGKTFQAIINMRVYQMLFGWIPTISMQQSFNIGTKNMFLSMDRCLFETDSVNDYNVWMNYFYNSLVGKEDKKVHLSLLMSQNLKEDYLASFLSNLTNRERIDITTVFELSGIDKDEISSSNYNHETDFGNNPLKAVSAHISKVIKKKIEACGDDVRKEDVLMFEQHNTQYKDGISLHPFTEMATMSGDGIPSTEQFVLLSKQTHITDDVNLSEFQTSSKIVLPTQSQKHDDLLEVIFKQTMDSDGSQKNTQENPASRTEDLNDRDLILEEKYYSAKELVKQIVQTENIPHVEAIDKYLKDKKYMSLSRLHNSGVSILDKDIKNSILQNISSLLDPTINSKMCDLVKKWAKSLLSVQTKAWDFFFSPRSSVNLPPLIVLPKGSTTVWLEELYKSLDCVHIAVINNALKEEIYGIIRKETHMTNSEIEFLTTTTIGKNESWYNSPRLLYTYPSYLSQMTSDFDFAVIHIDGLETEWKTIKGFISLVSSDTHILLQALEKSSNKAFSKAVTEKLTFVSYYREVKFFEAVFKSITDFKKRPEWKSFAKIHTLLKMITKGCKKYLDTYNTPGFFLNILQSTLEEDFKIFEKKIHEIIPSYKPGQRHTLPKDVSSIIDMISNLCKWSQRMKTELPAFATYVMNTSFCLSLDESHTIRNINQTWETFVAVPTDLRSFLTGTPLNNDESKELMNVIKMTNKFGPFTKTIELSHINVYENCEEHKNVQKLFVSAPIVHKVHTKEYTKLIYNLYILKSPSIRYRRNFPISFMGDRISRNIPHPTKWTSFSDSLGDIQLFHNCNNHCCHNIINKKQLWSNIQSYQSRATSHHVKPSSRDGTLDTYFNGFDSKTQKKQIDRISSIGKEQFTSDDIWGDNARTHLVDTMGRRITMNSPWNMGGIPLSLIYAHNNTSSNACVCRNCGSAARPYSEYQTVIQKVCDDIINISTEGDENDKMNQDDTEEDLDTTLDYEFHVSANSRSLSHKIVFGIMKNKSVYHPRNFICSENDYLYRYDCAMISHNIRSFWFNPPISKEISETSKLQKRYGTLETVNTNSALGHSKNSDDDDENQLKMKQLGQKYGFGSKRFKDAFSQNVNPTQIGSKKQTRPKKNISKKEDINKDNLDKMRLLFSMVEKRHQIRTDMQTSALCECYSTDTKFVNSNTQSIYSCFKSVYQNNTSSSRNSNDESDGMDVDEAIPASIDKDLMENAKLLLFLINYSGMRFQKNFGGCHRHNALTLHADTLLSEDTAEAVDDLQLITMSLIDIDFKTILLYRFLQSSVVLFAKYKKFKETKNCDTDLDIPLSVEIKKSELNLEEFHVWYFLHSGESFKDSNMHKKDAKSAEPIIKSIFGNEYSKLSQQSKSWYSDQFILHDEDEWLTENNILNKESNFVQNLDGDEMRQISSLVTSLISKHRQSMVGKMQSFVPKYRYSGFVNKPLLGENYVDEWHLYTTIFWGIVVPKPIMYKVSMSPEELDVYRYYIYGENMKKEDNQLLKDLTMSAGGVINKNVVRQVNKLLLSTTKNAMLCCENYFQKIPKTYSTHIGTILAELALKDNQDDTTEEKIELKQDENSDNSNTEDSDNSEDEKKVNKPKKLPKNHKRELYSEKLVSVFKTLNYQGPDILDPVVGLFNPGKMPSKYHGVVSYIINQTNICDDEPKLDTNKPEKDYLIIYVQTVKYVDHFAAYIHKLLGIKCSIYVGSGSKQKNSRFSELANFQKGDTRILIASLTIAGNSLNIPRANHVIFTLAWWNPQLEEQAKARVIRANQTKEVKFVFIVMNNALDEVIIDTGNKKGKGISGIFKNSSGISRADNNTFVYVHIDRHALEKAFHKHIPNSDISKNISIIKKFILEKNVTADDMSLEEMKKNILSNMDNNGNVNPLDLVKTSTPNSISPTKPGTITKLFSDKQKGTKNMPPKVANSNPTGHLGRFLEATKRLQEMSKNTLSNDAENV